MKFLAEATVSGTEYPPSRGGDGGYFKAADLLAKLEIVQVRQGICRVGIEARGDEYELRPKVRHRVQDLRPGGRELPFLVTLLP